LSSDDQNSVYAFAFLLMRWKLAFFRLRAGIRKRSWEIHAQKSYQKKSN